MTDYRRDDFSFGICPAVIEDQGPEMKRRICLSVAVIDPETGQCEGTTLRMDAAIERVCGAMLGGMAGLGNTCYQAMEGDGVPPFLDWNATVDKERLGIHPDIHAAVRGINDARTLFYRLTADGLEDASDGGNARAMAD